MLQIGPLFSQIEIKYQTILLPKEVHRNQNLNNVIEEIQAPNVSWTGSKALWQRAMGQGFWHMSPAADWGEWGGGGKGMGEMGNEEVLFISGDDHIEEKVNVHEIQEWNVWV